MEIRTIKGDGAVALREPWSVGVTGAGGQVLTELLPVAKSCGNANDPCGPNLPPCCQGLYCANDTHVCVNGG
jgi:hypothetical protein